MPIILSVDEFFVAAQIHGTRYGSSPDLVFDTDAYPRAEINFRFTGARQQVVIEQVRRAGV